MSWKHLEERLQERAPEIADVVLMAVFLGRFNLNGNSGYILVYSENTPVGIIPVLNGEPKTFLSKGMETYGSSLAVIRWKLFIRNGKVEFRELTKPKIWNTATGKWHST